MAIFWILSIVDIPGKSWSYLWGFWMNSLVIWGCICCRQGRWTRNHRIAEVELILWFAEFTMNSGYFVSDRSVFGWFLNWWLVVSLLFLLFVKLHLILYFFVYLVCCVSYLDLLDWMLDFLGWLSENCCLAFVQVQGRVIVKM